MSLPGERWQGGQQGERRHLQMLPPGRRPCQTPTCQVSLHKLRISPTAGISDIGVPQKKFYFEHFQLCKENGTLAW